MQGAWAISTTNRKPCPKNVIHVQHVIKIFQALPLLQPFAFTFAHGGGEPGSRLITSLVMSVVLSRLVSPASIMMAYLSRLNVSMFEWKVNVGT